MLHPFHLLMLPDQQFLDVMICRSRFNVDFLEVIQWKRTQFSDIYRLCRRIQFLNRQKSKNSMSLSFLVLLVSLSNFIGSFNMFAAYQTFLYCWFSGLCSLWFLPLGHLNNTLLQEPITQSLNLPCKPCQTSFACIFPFLETGGPQISTHYMLYSTILSI